MDEQKRIFLFASERSGSNLLRSLLGNHSEIHAPVAPHLMRTFYSKLKYYGNLSNPENAIKLLNHAIQVANHPYHNWEVDLQPRELYNKFKPTSLPACVDAIYTASAALKDKTSYFSKGNYNHDYAHYIKSSIPKVYFIYLHRDPRDHVASWMKKPIFMHTPYKIIRKWNMEQDACLTLLNIYPESICRLSYEELIATPEATITRILDFLDLPVEAACFKTNTENKESQRNPFWENLNKPIMASNTKKYKTSLKFSDIRVIESVACENMRALGYNDFDTDADWDNHKNPSFIFSELIRRRYSKLKNKKFRYEQMRQLQSRIDFNRKLQDELRNINNT